MKKIISILAAMVLTLAFGSAFADEWPTWEDKNTAAELSEKAYPEHKMKAGEAGAKGEAAGGVREEKSSITKAERDMIDSLFNTDRSRDLP